MAKYRNKSRSNPEFNKSSGLKSISKWIREGIDKDAINFADNFGEYLAKNISNSQVRNAYGEITRLKMRYNYSEVLMIKPKLAYAVGRETNRTKKDAYRVLYEIISKGIDEVANGKDENEQSKYFKNLAVFFEATLAYHKAYGGK